MSLEDDVPTSKFYRPKTLTLQPKERDDSIPADEVPEMSTDNPAPNHGASYRFHRRTSDVGLLVSVWALGLFIFVSPIPLGHWEDSAWSTINAHLAESKVDESYPLPSRFVDAMTGVDPSIGDAPPGRLLCPTLPLLQNLALYVLDFRD